MQRKLLEARNSCIRLADAYQKDRIFAESKHLEVAVHGADQQVLKKSLQPEIDHQEGNEGK